MAENEQTAPTTDGTCGTCRHSDSEHWDSHAGSHCDVEGCDCSEWTAAKDEQQERTYGHKVGCGAIQCPCCAYVPCEHCTCDKFTPPAQPKPEESPIEVTDVGRLQPNWPKPEEGERSFIDAPAVGKEVWEPYQQYDGRNYPPNEPSAQKGETCPDCDAPLNLITALLCSNDDCGTMLGMRPASAPSQPDVALRSDFGEHVCIDGSFKRYSGHLCSHAACWNAPQLDATLREIARELLRLDDWRLELAHEEEWWNGLRSITALTDEVKARGHALRSNLNLYGRQQKAALQRLREHLDAPQQELR